MFGLKKKEKLEEEFKIKLTLSSFLLPLMFYLLYSSEFKKDIFTFSSEIMTIIFNVAYESLLQSILVMLAFSIFIVGLLLSKIKIIQNWLDRDLFLGFFHVLVDMSIIMLMLLLLIFIFIVLFQKDLIGALIVLFILIIIIIINLILVKLKRKS